jgi:hypothetical protein
MNSFSTFKIQPPVQGFVGDKIKMSKLLNRDITVHAYKIEDSKVPAFQGKGTGKCLHLQISINGEMFINFTSSACLMDVIQQIPSDGFPFTTTIIQEGERFLFT